MFSPTPHPRPPPLPPPPSLPPPGQQRFRSLWERYCRGVQAIVFVVDSADVDALPTASRELHALLEKPSLKVGLTALLS